MITIEEQKLLPLIKQYKEGFNQYFPLEKYKWEAVKHFQDNWDIDAEDFPAMLSQSLSKTENLLASMSSFPRGMIIQFAERFPEEVKALFASLFDESKDLKERIETFIAGIEQIHKKWDGKEAKNHYQTLNAISTYLWLRYPDKYYIYKPTIASRLFEELGIEFRSRTLKSDAVIKTYELYDKISNILRQDEELKALLATSLTNNCYPDTQLCTTTTDFGYFIKTYYKPESPITSKRYWLYAPGENASKWERCQEQGIMCIGWDPLDDLSDIESIEDARIKLREAYNMPEASFTNDGRAIWEFAKEIQIGDIVFAKSGLTKIIGRGIVKSDYFYDPEQEDYRHVRKVEWTHVGEWPVEKLVLKTLTDISENKYPGYAKKLEEMIIGKEKQTTTMKPSKSISYDTKYLPYIKLLLNNRNLILNGAPGTGKTYLAKQIAAQIIFDGDVPKVFEEHEAFKNQCGFVQFHPSYDYTDFVEGLRPTRPNKDGNIGFERKDGVFKAFCKKALTRWQLSTSVSEEMGLDLFKDELKANNGITLKSFRSKTDIKVIVNEKGNIAIEIASKWSCTDEHMLKYLRHKECHDNDTYTKTIGDYILENYMAKKFWYGYSNSPKTRIFIIDEINRGEISKIFGELFFSIDPGYRGVKGKVQTQYQNLITEDDPFKDGFYIPENVYIIGTMNDIDRSVECMDFAMRRRFTFKEITAEESGINMGLSGEAIKRMQSLNNAISEIEGFNSSFHIGAAYYLGVTDYNELWELKLQGLLKEYLRGMPDAEETLETLKKAYELSSQDDNN